MSVNGLVPPASGRRLGSSGALFFAFAAATPLSVVVLGLPAAYAAGLRFVPWGFLVLGLLLLIFSVGYTAMARRAPTTGPLYTLIARGLGRPLGVGAAWVALLAYNALQIGLYGAARPLLASLGVTRPWWQVAAACWLLVAVLGFVRVAAVGWLLAVAVLAETAVIAGFSAANILEPANDRITVSIPHLSQLDRPATGLLLVLAALSFIGFETALGYGSASRRATYLTVALLTLLYVSAAWAMNLGAGPGIASTAASRGPELPFDLAAARLAPWTVTLGRTVLLTGLVAALVALHHTIARYLVALGHDRVLPSGLGRRAASLTQTVVAGLVLGGAAYLGLDPQTELARRLAVSGSVGILLLLTLTSLAALIFLNRVPNGENAAQRFLAPGVATIALGALGYLAVVNLGALLGVDRHDPLTLIVPGGYAAALLLGVGYGLALRKARPIAYAGIGLSGTAVIVSPASPPIPKPREPGAHRPERINRELTP